MIAPQHATRSIAWALALLAGLAAAGCRPFDHYPQSLDMPEGPVEDAPGREKQMRTLPAYRIEPPDILQLEVQKLVPLPPYRVEPMDVLQVNAAPNSVLPDQPINNYFLVDSDGRVSLGPSYGAVRVSGMTINEATRAVETHLREAVGLRLPEISVQLARPSSVQVINGNYLVSSDGSVNLRQYGTVVVAGMTLQEARLAVQRQLAHYFDNPKVSLDVVAYNSKMYYIITEGAGLGDNIVRIPVTGNDTVLDALTNVRGLSQVSSKRIWIARPASPGFPCEQRLPVDYDAIVRGAATATNYQLMPGDRLFVASDSMVAFTNHLNKLVAPVERLFGVVGLASSTARNTQTLGRDFNRQNNQLGR